MPEMDFAIAVFPFLKTSASVQIGGYTFRSTDDVGGLAQHHAEAVRETAQMLFVQDGFRVRTATYAILPALEVHSADPRLTHLAHLREVVAYLYASPHEIFGDVFLAPEEISLALFQPSRVSVLITRPQHHTESTDELASHPEPDQFNFVPGYRGLYNFRHAFWIEPGARLYGPKPHMVLNISQDLGPDFTHRRCHRPDFDLLLGLLEKPPTPASLRIFSALHWFNAANEENVDLSQSLLHLAIAFETLLKLPASSKTDRLVDAISLLLGRTERLDSWAEQFYAARSRVVHEGSVRDQHFYASNSSKKQASDIFGSLILYGRQVFQLCLATLIVGVDLADQASLQEKFVTNNERYQAICEILQGEDGSVSDRLLRLEPITKAIKRYLFVVSSVDVGLTLGAARLAAVTLVACHQNLATDLSLALANCAAVKREDGELERLAATEALHSSFRKQERQTLSTEARIVCDLVDLVWMSVFPKYYWLRDRERQS